MEGLQPGTQVKWPGACKVEATAGSFTTYTDREFMPGFLHHWELPDMQASRLLVLQLFPGSF